MSQPPYDPSGTPDPDRPGDQPQPWGQPAPGPGEGSRPPSYDPGQPGSYGRPPPASPPPGSGSNAPFGGGGPSPSNFFSALTDLSFRSYVTPHIVKFVYILAIALGVIYWILAIVIGFSNDALLGVIALVFGPIALILWIALLRMTLEFYHAITTMSLHIRGLNDET